MNLTVFLKGIHILIITEAPLCLKNNNSNMRVAYNLFRLQTEIGAHGFWNPSAVAIGYSR